VKPASGPGDENLPEVFAPLDLGVSMFHANRLGSDDADKAADSSDWARVPGHRHQTRFVADPESRPEVEVRST
jgi:hypothetical protein